MHALHCGLMTAWICGMIGLILLIIAVNTDHWVSYDVLESPEVRLPYRGYPYAYDRGMGLFRECFTGDFPPPADVAYTTAFGHKCLNVIGRWLYPRDEISEIIQVKIHSQTIWAHLITGGVGIVSLLVALTVGFAAWCVNFPSCLILATGTTLVISLILFCTSMGLWHAAKFMRQDSIQLDGYYTNWPTVIKNNTETRFDWSYMVVWSGIVAVLMACLVQLVCYCIAKSNSEDKRNRKLMSYYQHRRNRHKVLSSSRKPEDSPMEEEDSIREKHYYNQYPGGRKGFQPEGGKHPRQHKDRGYPIDPTDLTRGKSSNGGIKHGLHHPPKNNHHNSYAALDATTEPTNPVLPPVAGTTNHAAANYNSNFSNYSQATNGITADDKSTLVSPPTNNLLYQEHNNVPPNGGHHSTNLQQQQRHKAKKRRKNHREKSQEPLGVLAETWDDSVHDKSKYGPKPVRNLEVGDLEEGVVTGSSNATGTTALSRGGGRAGGRK